MAKVLLVIIYITFIGLGIPDSLFGTAWPAIYMEFGLPVVRRPVKARSSRYRTAGNKDKELSMSKEKSEELTNAGEQYTGENLISLYPKFEALVPE